MAEAPKILVVLTSHATLGDTGRPTGFYLSELAHPYAVFTSQGFSVTLASPSGGAAPLDPSSVEAAATDPISQSFFDDNKSLWESTAPLEAFLGHSDDFAALFYPGGHGPMFDLAVDPVSQALIGEFAAKGKVVAAVCHGPAVFVGVKGDGGESFLAGKRVTGLSNAEEVEVGLDKAVPFLLEDRLIELVGPDGRYEKAEGNWEEKVVVDGKLITGQNPASAKGVAEAIAQAAWGA
ncbi:class I glutamine amidotransferase-like protein [Staphylotrichum tortipilum]|uniref:D-lactate dehydratase n=1 Tax=Staphylotrichum tortipilum TaxID=2831512 RepID=A0AAN6MRT9_9PEZI|nr:class I glutamine amidotransferase-like protein [Staphylotrichum longicolle]